MTKKNDKEEYLTKIPILGYFFRKIKENRQAIETTLKTGKETQGKIKKKSFLGGILNIISSKTFRLLKSKKKNEKKKTKRSYCQ